MISLDDYCFFVDDAIDGMVAIVEELGDDLANRPLDLPDANSPYVVLHHCIAVMEFWGGHLIAGRGTTRDREAELRSRGKVEDLVIRAREAQAQLALDARNADFAAPLRNVPLDPDDLELARGRTQGGALIHIYEELAQHRGQMEVSRDVLRAPWGEHT